MAAASAEAGRRADWRRIVAAALTGLILFVVAAYAARTANAIRQVSLVRGAAALADRTPSASAALAAVPEPSMRLALTGSPLLQRLVNVAMTSAVDAGDAPEPWVRQLRQLGWRDSVSLQNSLTLAVARVDIRTILDTCDALLRRREATERIVPVLSMLEVEPEMRRVVARRLAGRPVWRGDYLSSTGHLRSPEQLVARYALLRELGALDAVTEGEAITAIRVFEAGGRTDLAVALWRTLLPQRGAVSDPTFTRAAARDSMAAEESVVDLDWALLTGEGYGTSAYVENGSAQLDINWDGRGVPVFARQRTTGRRGAYQLAVQQVQGGDALGVLGFQLTCGNTVTPLRPVPGLVGRYRTDGVVSCDYPVLEITGTLQPTTTPHQINLRSLQLLPV
ncbi:hypothetical protein SAMN06297144_1121 [Sphingomonas guangdongensis]|uniref:Uncharacterized protein n=1 Tax=Sphingomonas guangdongensis TaxID=1141890 RepID=A0A285QGB5_9SPHN|nr:hypothetical protein [Sphingomonas guangdongensis]SOB80558.1 hypothetical protein SAMN06297144_1121 [Sphingomonas guangdongensis]